MNIKDDCKTGRFSWLTNPAIILGILAYATTIILWGARQEGRINSIVSDIALIHQQHNNLSKKVDELDKSGTRQIPALEIEIRTLTDAINRHINQTNQGK